jgi:acetyltransferase-like isoleucine patch superfamily enzyme
MLFKMKWAVRAIFYKFFFGHVGWLTYIGKPAFYMRQKSIFIGDKVRIFPGARLEVHGDGRLEIADNVSIGHGIHIACADNLVINKGVLISSNVLITDIDHVYGDVASPVFDQGIKVKKTYIGENCFIGDGAKILAGSYLAPGTVVGANAVVRGEYLKSCVIASGKSTVIKEL